MFTGFNQIYEVLKKRRQRAGMERRDEEKKTLCNGKDKGVPLHALIHEKSEKVSNRIHYGKGRES